MAATKTGTAADEIRRLAKEDGLTVTAKISRERSGRAIDATITVETTFTPGDAGAYIAAEHACNDVLARFRMIRPGSTWGTDSGSVGGHAGLTGGYCRMNKSGVEVRLARQFEAPKVQTAAGDAGPSAACWEYQDGELPIRLSFSIKVF